MRIRLIKVLIIGPAKDKEKETMVITIQIHDNNNDRFERRGLSYRDLQDLDRL